MYKHLFPFQCSTVLQTVFNCFTLQFLQHFIQEFKCILDLVIAPFHPFL